MDGDVRYEVRIGDAAVEVRGADAYGPDGSLTTFYRCREGRAVIDSWATRVASFRTTDIASIVRHDTRLAWVD